MTQENSTDNSLAGATHVDAADGAAAVPSLPLAELNTILGKDFKDTGTALKALKDTQAFVGKRKEDIAAEVRAELGNTSGNASSSSNANSSSTSALESTVKSLQEDIFYTQNPQYKDLRESIKLMGANPADVVATEAFKKIFVKVQAADEVEKTRSVVSSNQRLAQSKTHTESAVAVANARGTTTDDVAASLVGGIREEFGL